ncbi:MAG: hypothetical protein MZW92_01255 [Comamonadaceae bacterium]|nr:hypothetical protein [Comamonadaceae bacterium]
MEQRCTLFSSPTAWQRPSTITLSTRHVAGRDRWTRPWLVLLAAIGLFSFVTLQHVERIRAALRPEPRCSAMRDAGGAARRSRSCATTSIAMAVQAGRDAGAHRCAWTRSASGLAKLAGIKPEEFHFERAARPGRRRPAAAMPRRPDR